MVFGQQDEGELMPYIKQADREEIEDEIHDFIAHNAGELNYIITVICNDYLSYRAEKYQTYNDIIGVLECAKMEYYRRKVAPYEDDKIKENGDV